MMERQNSYVVYPAYEAGCLPYMFKQCLFANPSIFSVLYFASLGNIFAYLWIAFTIRVGFASRTDFFDVNATACFPRSKSGNNFLFLAFFTLLVLNCSDRFIFLFCHEKSPWVCIHHKGEQHLFINTENKDG